MPALTLCLQPTVLSWLLNLSHLPVAPILVLDSQAAVDAILGACLVPGNTFCPTSTTLIPDNPRSVSPVPGAHASETMRTSLFRPLERPPRPERGSTTVQQSDLRIRASQGSLALALSLQVEPLVRFVCSLLCLPEPPLTVIMGVFYLFTLARGAAQLEDTHINWVKLLLQSKVTRTGLTVRRAPACLLRQAHVLPS